MMYEMASDFETTVQRTNRAALSEKIRGSEIFAEYGTDISEAFMALRQSACTDLGNGFIASV